MKAHYGLTWRFPGGHTLQGPGYRPLNLLAHAEIEGVTVPQACGGQAECGTCRVKVISGEVTDASADELDLRSRYPKRFAPNERLACRARPRSDVVVEVRATRPPDLRDLDGE